MVVKSLMTEKSDMTVYSKLQDLERHHPSNDPHNTAPSSAPNGNHLQAGSRGSSKRLLGVVFIVLLFIAILALCVLFILSFKLNLKVMQESWPFLGHHATTGKAGLHRGSNDADLVIKYKLDNSQEETTVYRNYRSGYETMKSSSALRSACYVKKMQLNDMRNSTAITTSLKQQYKSHFYNVIDPPIGARESLDWLMGDNAFRDCSQSKVQWIQPMQYEVYVAPVHPSSTNHTFVPNDGDNGHRERRSIRSCRQTCCWRVCCCDVHHFQWQVAEEFNCNHVCNKCSKHYKSVIQKLC